MARRTYTESIDDVYQLVNQYSEDFDQTISLKFSPALGFHLSLTLAPGVAIPPVFVNVTRKKHKVTCSTLELVGIPCSLGSFRDDPFNLLSTIS